MAIFRAKPSDNRLRPAWSATLPDCAHAVAWSADGKRLAAAAVSGPVRVFDFSGKVVADLAGHGFGTTAIAFAPDGDRLATAGQDGKVRIWDTHLWQERAALPGGAAWVERLAFHPTTGVLASAGGKSIRLWDAAGNLVREFAGHKSTVADLAWKPGSTLLAAAPYGGVVVYDPAQSDPVREYKWRGAPLAIAWSPNAAMIAHGNQDATVHFWYAETGEELQMSGYPNKVTALAWDYTSRYLATGGGDKTCVWDCSGTGPAGSTPTMLDGHAAAVSAVAYQRRGFLLVSGAKDGTVCLSQPTAKKGPLVGTATGDGEVMTVVWSPDDCAVAVGFGSGQVQVFRV